MPALFAERVGVLAVCGKTDKSAHNYLSQIVAGDTICRGRSPIFALCRALLAAGADPASRLECYRGETLCITVKAIGIGATLTIEEGPSRPRVARWSHFPALDSPRASVDSWRGIPLPDLVRGADEVPPIEVSAGGLHGKGPG